MRARLAALLLAAALGAGCGGESAAGEATLWVTRDRGQHVLVDVSVRAGQTAMQALDRETDLVTRYGGRFVQAIDGLEGSAARRVDWFWFVNGIEADRSAAEYRLHSGDVVWFDYRSWRGRMREPVVVGAFPEPFLHGYGGRRRPVAVRYAAPELEAGARAVARLLGAESVAPVRVAVPEGANAFLIEDGGTFRLQPDRGREPARAGDPVTFLFGGDARRLARDPSLVRFRYEVP